ncbi:MAG: hypothetical protein OQJ91_12680 [Motiliproteus sp.]|nr:hypothetical protein [Motiliproteus sp.]
METNEVMARQEEFNDIPELGPASDDLDRTDIPTLKPLNEIPAKTVRDSQRKRGNGPVYFMILLLAAAVAAGGFFSFQKIDQLNRQLAASELALANTQNRLADIESLVSATDESVNKSGAALQAQLKQQLNEGQGRVKHIDSEIAKLWAVYQKYKPQIEALDKQQKSQGKELAAHKAELKTVGESLDTIGLSMDKQRLGVEQAQDSVTKTQSDIDRAQKRLTAFDKSLTEVDKTLKASGQKQAAEMGKLSEELRLQDLANQEVDDLQAARMDEMQKSLEAMRSKSQIPASVKNQLQEQQKALNSINSYRRQINSEILKLRKRVSQLQLSVENTPPAAR